MNKGDTIVCIKPGPYIFLTYGKKYVILDIQVDYNYISIIDDAGSVNSFIPKRFCSLTDYREKQINDLLI